MTEFVLKHPFEFRGTKYSKMTARRPKVHDLRTFMKDLDKDPILAMEKVLGNLCDVDNAVIAELDIEDFAPIKLWFEDFLRPMVASSNDT